MNSEQKHSILENGTVSDLRWQSGEASCQWSLV